MGAFSESVTLYVKELGPAAAAALREQAILVEKEIEVGQSTRRGITPITHIYLNGQPVTDFSGVKADSIILLNFDYRQEIIKAAFEQLRTRAPVQSGAYRDSFTVMLDGAGLAPGQLPNGAQLRDVEVVTIANPIRYARRLEVGITESGRTFVKQVEPHIVESAMRAVRNEFKSVTRMDFAYVNLSNAYVARTDFSNRRRVRGGWRATYRRDRGKGVAITYPAITIERL